MPKKYIKQLKGQQTLTQQGFKGITKNVKHMVNKKQIKGKKNKNQTLTQLMDIDAPLTFNLNVFRNNN